MYNYFMPNSEDLRHDILDLKNYNNTTIDQIIELSALQERARIFEHLGSLIQEKDSHNDIIAAKVLAWAWFELSS